MRGHILVALLVACGGNNEARPTDCVDGEMRECYSGPDGTAGAGPCITGLEICSGGRWPGICIGDVVPRVERCNGADDNCNGIVDDVPELGQACTGSNGCEGARMCDDKGRVRCFAPAKNECDVCGGPDVVDLGDECTANSCLGALVCAADGRGSECNAPTQNECGVCGGPAVAGLGTSCMSSDGCMGELVCDLEGATAMCNAPVFNECMVCGPPLGITVGGTCTGARGCIGVTACNMTGDGAECTLDASCPHIVISEVATASAICNTDELIELYNPSMRAVSLAGYTLRSRSASSGNFTRLVTFAQDAVIAPHGYFLVVSTRSSNGCSNDPNPGGGYPAVAGNTVTADATYAAIDLSATVGSLWLTTTDQNPTGVTDTIVVDVVGFDDDAAGGTQTLFEGSGPAPAPQSAAPSGSIERKATAGSTAGSLAAGGAEATAGNGRDSDDNAADFVAQATRVPQNTASSPEP